MNTPQPPEPNMGDPGAPHARMSDAEWVAFLGNDDLAPGLLSAALNAVDPVPYWVPLEAQAVWHGRDLDAELVDLLSESSSVGASRSVTDDLRILVFGNVAQTLKIEVSIRHDVSGPVITGTLTATNVASGVELLDGLTWEGSPPLREEPVELDRFGRFEILPVNATRARIRFDSRNRSGAVLSDSLLVTPWFDIY